MQPTNETPDGAVAGMVVVGVIILIIFGAWRISCIESEAAARRQMLQQHEDLYKFKRAVDKLESL